MATTAARPPLDRESIVSAAREMIRVGGLESLSLRRLAGVLGVTAAALYAHVDDKEDLLRAVAEGEFASLVAAYESVTEDSPRDHMVAQARAYVGHARREPELFRVMFLFPPAPFDATAAGPPELPAATTAFTIASTTVGEAMDAGFIAAGDVLETTLLFWAAMHGLATIFQLGLGLGSDTEDRLIAEMIGRLAAGPRHHD